MADIDVTSGPLEDIVRKLRRAEAHPFVVEIIVEQHEQIITLQRAVNELLTQMTGLVQALSLMNAGFKQHGQMLNNIAARYSDPHKEMVQAAERKSEED